MAEDRAERRLAAILAADVVGYSRLMGEDEEGTLRALMTHRRELIDPKVTEHHGRIVKTTGDGALVEFASVVDAVRCAVEVQRGMAERNALVPKDKRIAFRIGINVGDIIIQGGDIFGDGVNVAARLEGLAPPGGICVSGVVRDQVRDKLSFAFEDMAERSVKNIARPVHVYLVKDEEGLTSPHVVTHRAASRRTVIWGTVALLVFVLAAGGAWLAKERAAPVVRFNEAKLRALAQKQQIPLPERIGLAPVGDIPPNMASYLGAWGGDEQWGGVGRHVILLVTSVDRTGAAAGFYGESAPTPNSFTQSPAHFYAVTGRIDGDGFKFDLGQSTFSFVAMSNGFIYGKVVNANRTSRISLEHVE